MYKQKILLVCLLILFVSVRTHAQDPQLAKLKKIKNADSAMLFAGELLSAARQKHDKAQEARILYQQSKIVYRTGDNAKALKYARQALALATPADSNTYANSSTMIAYMLSQQGKDVEALKVAFKILSETDKYGWKKLNIYSLACVADLYRGVKDIPKALVYAHQAADGAKALKDSAQYIFTISTLSNLYSDKIVRNAASMKKAIAYMDIILSPPYAKLLSPFDKARYLGNLGRLYVIQNDPRAQPTLERSLAISGAEGFEKLQISALVELMTLYIANGQYTQGIKYGEEILRLNIRQSPISVRKSVYEKLGWAYEGTKDYKRALAYYQKTSVLIDSINASDKANDAAELDKKYQADKRLLLAANKTKLIQQQRNYIIVLSVFVLLALIATYRWVTYNRNKKAVLLAQEHEQLARLDALKTRFFANVSHELRTPLTLIMGPAEMLLHKQVTDEVQQQNYLLNIVRNSKKLLNIVNELLDLGKLEAGKLAIKLKPVALAPFVKIIYQAFSSAAEYKKIDYQLHCDIDEQLFAQLDQERFEKISNNLIGNAMKFTPEGGSITITAAIVDQNIQFNVANTGTGIHPDDVPFIFDRYYQGHKSQQALEGGTGIGLAIAREFAELMGGTLTIDNNWGTGTTFKVSIPLIVAAPNEVEAAGDEGKIIQRSVNTNEKPLVMVVEDNAEMSAYISNILQPNYELISAGNGAEALRVLNGLKVLPNLIISDVMMPEMDGFTLLEKLKQSNALCNIPVIMLTALADTQHRLKALNTGVDDYITKPFLTSELIARAGNLISNAAARGGTAMTTGDDTAITEVEEELLKDGDEEVVLMPPSPADLVWLAQLEALVRKNTGKTDLNIAGLSYEIGLSERQLFRRIKHITGLTPNRYIRAIRLQIAREAIGSGKYRTIAEVSYAAGFDTPAYFSKLFKEHYGRDVGDLL